MTDSYNKDIEERLIKKVSFSSNISLKSSELDQDRKSTNTSYTYSQNSQCEYTEKVSQRLCNKCIEAQRGRKYYDVAYEKQLYFVKVISKEELELTDYANYYNHLKLLKVNPKHIYKLKGHFEHLSSMYFIYERGESDLLDLLSKNGSTPLKRKLEILRDVAEGLFALHRTELVHMDLKIDNVMMFGNAAKIIDLESSIDISSHLSEEVHVKSSYSCMPPEVYEYDLAKFGTSIDCWSYGMLLYEVLTSQTIIETCNQENGYTKINYFLQNKHKYIEILIDEIKDDDRVREQELKAKIQYLFNSLTQHDPNDRIKIQEVITTIQSLLSLYIM